MVALVKNTYIRDQLFESIDLGSSISAVVGILHIDDFKARRLVYP